MNRDFNLPPGVTAKDIDALSGPRMDVCEDCDGEGRIYESNCCGAAFAEPGFPDNDICSEYHEHAEPCKCERCDGNGRINVQAEADQRRVDAEEHKADIDRDK